MSASNTTRRLGNQASLGISFGLFFLYLLMKVAMGYLQSSWWNSLRLLALDDNSVWGRKLLYMYFKQRLWDLGLLACQVTLKFRFIFLNLWVNHSVHTLYIRAITKATPQEDETCYFSTKKEAKELSNNCSMPYVLIYNNYSPKWRWLVVGIYWCKYPPLATNTKVNNNFSIY